MVVEAVQHEILETPVTIYNFEVEDFHTYYVGEQSVLVHNANYSGNTSRIQIIDCKKGTFRITDWSDYPDDYVPMPDTDTVWTLRIGDDYEKARDAADTVNKAIRKKDNYHSKNQLEIHEIIPVKFGGSPTDISNKVGIQGKAHRRYVTPWWNSIQAEAERALGIK